jgi:hypothetical protein
MERGAELFGESLIGDWQGDPIVERLPNGAGSEFLLLQRRLVVFLAFLQKRRGSATASTSVHALERFPSHNTSHHHRRLPLAPTGSIYGGPRRHSLENESRRTENVQIQGDDDDDSDEDSDGLLARIVYASLSLKIQGYSDDDSDEDPDESLLDNIFYPSSFPSGHPRRQYGRGGYANYGPAPGSRPASYYGPRTLGSSYRDPRMHSLDRKFYRMENLKMQGDDDDDSDEDSNGLLTRIVYASLNLQIQGDDDDDSDEDSDDLLDKMFYPSLSSSGRPRRSDRGRGGYVKYGSPPGSPLTSYYGPGNPGSQRPTGPPYGQHTPGSSIFAAVIHSDVHEHEHWQSSFNQDTSHHNPTDCSGSIDSSTLFPQGNNWIHFINSKPFPHSFEEWGTLCEDENRWNAFVQACSYDSGKMSDVSEVLYTVSVIWVSQINCSWYLA